MKVNFSRGKEAVDEERIIDLSFDGGSYVNWKVSRPILSLSLMADSTMGTVHDFSFPDTDDAQFGVIDLTDLYPVEYQIVINGNIEQLRVVAPNSGEIGVGTRNQGITNEHVWEFRQSDEGLLFLSPTRKDDLHPAVVGLDAALGIVVVDVAPIPADGSDHKLFLVRRKKKDMFVELGADSSKGDNRRYVLTSDVWERLNIPLDGEKTTWDLFTSSNENLTRDKRLTWRGSSTANPRETVRFRATTSWVKSGKLYRIRPYWTLDQYLALEITNSSNSEGSYK